MILQSQLRDRKTGAFIKMAKMRWLYELPLGIKYTDILPAALSYHTVKTGYNSKQRMGMLLFGKIVKEYTNILFEKLISGEKIKFAGSAPIQMFIRRNGDAFTDDEKFDQLAISMYHYDGKRLFQYNYEMTKSMQFYVMEKIKQGHVYPKKLRNAAKYKVLYS